MGKIQNIAKFRHLKKIGRGKRCWWRLGQFNDSLRDFTIGLRLRDDGANKTVQLLFSDNDQNMLGFVLLEVKQGCCALMGIKTNDNARGQGLSAIFIACWLEICDRFDVQPEANRIDKPLIALLMAKFEFQPLKRAFECEISIDPQNKEEAVIWFPEERRETMTTILSHRRLRSQKMKLVQEKPELSTTIFLGSRFVAPMKQRLANIVQPLVRGKIHFDCDSFKVNFCDPDFFQDLNYDEHIRPRSDDFLEKEKGGNIG